MLKVGLILILFLVFVYLLMRNIVSMTFAIRCIERCMDVKSEILDHANVQTTLQMYVYPSTTSKRDTMEAASMLAGIAKNFLFL